MRRGVRPGDDGFEQGPQPDHRNRSGEFLLTCVWAIGLTACFFKVNVSDPSHSPMSTLVNPGRFAVPPPVVALTGITNAMVSAPAVPSFQRAAELFQEYIDEARR